MYGQLIDRATGAAAINHSLSKPYKWQFEELRLRLSNVGNAGNLVLQIHSATNAVYNTVILTQDMTTIQNLVFRPPATIKLDKGDRLVVTWANAAARTYGLEIVYY